MSVACVRCGGVGGVQDASGNARPCPEPRCIVHMRLRRLSLHVDRDKSLDGAIVVHDWLQSHLPDGMMLPAVVENDGLLDKVKVVDLREGRRELDKSYLGTVEHFGGRRPDAKVLTTAAIIEAAVKADGRVTGDRIATWWLSLYSGDFLEREGASAVLAYLCGPLGSERRVTEAADIILARLRERGDSTYPAVLVNLVVDRLRGKLGKRSNRIITYAFMRAGCIALDGRMSIASGTGRADGKGGGDDAATLIARAFENASDFHVTSDTVARAGIKYRHDREFLPDSEKSRP